MPDKSPKKFDNQDSWMDYCLSDKQIKSEYPITPKNQRYAVCISMWQNRNKKKESIKESINIFKKNDTGMPFYNDMIKKPDYFKKAKRLIFNIKYMSPDEYIDRAADIHNVSYKRELDMIDKNLIDKYVNNAKRGDKFPILVLNYANKTQEGRHRAIVAKKLNIKKIPVMMVNELFGNKDNYLNIIQDEEIIMTKKQIRKAVREELNSIINEVDNDDVDFVLDKVSKELASGDEYDYDLYTTIEIICDVLKKYKFIKKYPGSNLINRIEKMVKKELKYDPEPITLDNVDVIYKIISITIDLLESNELL